MPWIRFDCATLDDEFMIDTLTDSEFKAYTLFLLRIKAMGARGSVAIAPLSSLARNWGMDEPPIVSMLKKAKERIVQRDGRWYVKNWRKYQEDYRDKSASPEKTGDDTDATTITVHHTTPQDSTKSKRMARTQISNKAIPKSLEDVAAYFKSLGSSPAEAEKFFDHFQSNGWKISGKAPMKDWQAAVRNWIRRSSQTQASATGYTAPKRGYWCSQCLDSHPEGEHTK